jgi:hypothetical protein
MIDIIKTYIKKQRENIMIEFVKQNWQFFVAGIILLALTAYWIFEVVRSKRAKERELNEMEAKLEELEEEEKQPVKDSPKQEKAKAEKVVATPSKTNKPVEPEVKEGDYMVSYDDEKKDWVVKKQGSKRATKRTKTKQEALDVVKKLTENQEVDVVVKKKDGNVQK